MHRQASPTWATIALAVFVVAAGPASAQTSGNLYRGNGPPVAFTTLDTPHRRPLGPMPSPQGSPTLAPSSAELAAMAPALETYFNGTSVRGQCYCSPAFNGTTYCYHELESARNFQAYDSDCNPPLDLNCTLVVFPPNQRLAGSYYRCKVPATSGTPAVPATTTSTGTDDSGITVTGPTPLLSKGQEILTGPDSPSLRLEIEGADIVMNGDLNGRSVEPPSPVVCAGNGFVMEVTNSVLIAYSSKNGSVVAGPTDFSAFFSVQAPPYNNLTNPYCIYDAADSKRFFVSVAYSSCGTATCLNRGSIPMFSYLLIGVSKTSDPRDGFLGPYFVATDGIDPDTNEAYPNFANCAQIPKGYTGKGCLGDYPTPGIDKYGFWFGANLFTINGETFIGANVYGVRKADLLSGKYTNPSVVTYTNWDPYPGATIVPSLTQATSNHSEDSGGSIFLLSSDSFLFGQQPVDGGTAPGSSTMRSWAITNTSLLQQNFPGGATPTLSKPVEIATQPLQYDGDTLSRPGSATVTSIPQPSGPGLTVPDERMRQVAFTGGCLYSCLQTPVNISGGIWTGLAYFVVKPAFTADGTYNATLENQGYVAANGTHLLNGAITASVNGSAVITGSIVGPDTYLSAFYAHITPETGPGPLRVPRPSSDPLSNEGPNQSNQRRTGDYSAATLDEEGTAWLVAEWASDEYASLFTTESRLPRRANWGTYIMAVDPNVLD